MQEDKKHRKTYEALGDSEQKLQFFSARQIACRLLGSRGYLCQKVFGYFVKIIFHFHQVYLLPLGEVILKHVHPRRDQYALLLLNIFISCSLSLRRLIITMQCWLPSEEDCMCSRVTQCTLWNRMRFWLYMHPKVFYCSL